MITPIIMPVPVSSSDPNTCPDCGVIESIKEVCRHCGHEYITDCPHPLIITALVVLTLWALVTVTWWFLDQGDYGGRHSLWGVIKSQGRFIRKLRIF